MSTMELNSSPYVQEGGFGSHHDLRGSGRYTPGPELYMNRSNNPEMYGSFNSMPRNRQKQKKVEYWDGYVESHDTYHNPHTSGQGAVSKRPVSRHASTPGSSPPPLVISVCDVWCSVTEAVTVVSVSIPCSIIYLRYLFTPVFQLKEGLIQS